VKPNRLPPSPAAPVARAAALCAALLALAAAGPLTAAETPAAAPAAPAPRAAKAADPVQGCEGAVVESLRRTRGRDATDVQFQPGARVSDAPGGGDEVSVKGEGRYRYAGRIVGFSYGCAVNLASGATSGAVIRETGPNAPGAQETPFQPDLSRISPADCESLAAAALKRRHPRVDRITLDSESRRLSPGPDQRVLLEGRGAMQPAPGMYAVPFTYRCEIDPRNGRIVAVDAGS
jgi:hypothetical protein